MNLARADRGGLRAAAVGTAIVAAAGITLVAPVPSGAVPDWRTQRSIGALTVFADDRRPNRFYYAPPEIEVATGPDGKPDFHFLMTRYTGASVGRDRGVISHKSLVTFRVRLPRVPAAEMDRAVKALRAGGATPELRPFPIRRLSTALVYSVIGGADTVSLPEGRFEASSEGNVAPGEGYWTERVYTIGLDSLTAQAFGAALERDQVYLSLGYAFLAEVAGADPGPPELRGSPELVGALRQSVAAQSVDSVGADSTGIKVVRAGAIGIGLDLKRFPELMRRVDLNDRVPPGYAALDVYCYDFNNELRPDLAEKQVEINAESVAGKRVNLHAYFRRDQADVYATSIRFPVAVRLDRPYRYRVKEVKQDGTSRAGAWLEVASWSRILDVTTPPKEAGVRSILGP